MKHAPIPRPGGRPVVKIRVALLDPWKRSVTIAPIPMSPQMIQELLRCPNPSFGKLGGKGSIDIMIAGNKLPQVKMLGNVEPEFTVEDEFGKLGPVLHGRAMVFGFLPAPQKAASIPVGLPWLTPKINWSASDAIS